MPTLGSDGGSGKRPDGRLLAILVIGLAMLGGAGIALVTGALPDPGARAGDVAHGPAPAEVARPRALVWPWEAIGRVERASGGHCTGTLIAPDLVLTAGHCVSGPGGAALPAEAVTFALADAVGTGAASSGVTEILRPRNLPSPGDDFAVLRLDAPLEVRPVPLLPEGEPPPGHGLNGRVVLAGYGPDLASRLAVQQDCRVLGLAGASVARHTCTSANGSSGGPVLWGVVPPKDGESAGLDRARVAGVAIGYAADGSSPRGVLITAPVLRTFMASLAASVGPETETTGGGQH